MTVPVPLPEPQQTTVPYYPNTFPCPMYSGYGVDVENGLVRTRFANGQTRQRRRHRQVHTVIRLQFTIPVQLLGDWQVWMNENGTQWFLIDLFSAINGVNETVPHKVHVISDLAIGAITRDYVDVSLTVEVDQDYLYVPPVTNTGDWIIAQTPPTPSADWYIAKQPDDPADDTVIAGTPGNPAA